MMECVPTCKHTHTERQPAKPFGSIWFISSHQMDVDTYSLLYHCKHTHSTPQSTEATLSNRWIHIFLFFVSICGRSTLCWSSGCRQPLQRGVCCLPSKHNQSAAQRLRRLIPHRAGPQADSNPIPAGDRETISWERSVDEEKKQKDEFVPHTPTPPPPRGNRHQALSPSINIIPLPLSLPPTPTPLSFILSCILSLASSSSQPFNLKLTLCIFISFYLAISLKPSPFQICLFGTSCPRKHNTKY